MPVLTEMSLESSCTQDALHAPVLPFACSVRPVCHPLHCQQCDANRYAAWDSTPVIKRLQVIMPYRAGEGEPHFLDIKCSPLPA